MNYDFSDGFESTSREEGFTKYVDHIEYRHTDYAAICAKCYNIKGRISARCISTVFIEADSNEFSEDEIRDEVIKTSDELWESELLCPECKTKIRHFWVDGEIAELIQAINRSGFTTVYSCAGHHNHVTAVSSLYISVIGNHLKEFNDLPDGWLCSVERAYVRRVCVNVTRLCLDESIPISEYEDRITELTGYFNTLSHKE